MKKTYEELEELLRQERAYTEKLNAKIAELKELLKNSITPYQQQKEIGRVTREYEEKIRVLQAQSKGYENVGRKKVADENTIKRILELRETGLSYAKIAVQITEETGKTIGRTTVAEIVMGRYKP